MVAEEGQRSFSRGEGDTSSSRAGGEVLALEVVLVHMDNETDRLSERRMDKVQLKLLKKMYVAVLSEILHAHNMCFYIC